MPTTQGTLRGLAEASLRQATASSTRRGYVGNLRTAFLLTSTQVEHPRPEPLIDGIEKLKRIDLPPVRARLIRDPLTWPQPDFPSIRTVPLPHAASSRTMIAGAPLIGLLLLVLFTVLVVLPVIARGWTNLTTEEIAIYGGVLLVIAIVFVGFCSIKHGNAGSSYADFARRVGHRRWRSCRPPVHRSEGRSPARASGTPRPPRSPTVDWIAPARSPTFVWLQLERLRSPTN